jgi:serine phosphatase RsbU (regulator of sigma subunit)
VGIDEHDTRADFVDNLENYARVNTAIKFNVAFCLDSINGTPEQIEYQIGIIVQLLRKRDSRIYWRCVQGTWTPDLLHKLAQQFNYTIVDMELDTGDKIYCEWVSNQTSSYMNPY